MKAHILVVEDEAVLYERMRMILVKEHYSVSDYVPSVEEALIAINNKRPDLVLLDIDLQGEKNGLYLGEKLSKTYKIPFIYVTQYNDNETFYKGLATHHDHYMVKTKPRFDSQELIRTIQTILNKKNTQEAVVSTQKGVLGLTNYLDELKKMGKGEISKVPVLFENIAFFTVKPFLNENEEEEEIRVNYLWFLTKGKEYYFLKSSLKELSAKLPQNFVRINESYIVNISPHILEGRINGSKISIMKRELIINETYKEEVKKRFNLLYRS